jgi:hypothetical protein
MVEELGVELKLELDGQPEATVVFVCIDIRIDEGYTNMQLLASSPQDESLSYMRLRDILHINAQPHINKVVEAGISIQ